MLSRQYRRMLQALGRFTHSKSHSCISWSDSRYTVHITSQTLCRYGVSSLPSRVRRYTTPPGRLNDTQSRGQCTSMYDLVTAVSVKSCRQSVDDISILLTGSSLGQDHPNPSLSRVSLCCRGMDVVTGIKTQTRKQA